MLAFELGYKALPGVMAQPVQSWGEVKQVLRDLKRPEVKEVYSTIVVDTVDIASQLCEKYMCNQLGIENIGDGGWATNGWAKYKKEFEDTFRSLTQLGYAVLFISHDKEKTIKHEYGHQKQSLYLGWFYLLIIGIPSFLGNIWDRIQQAGSNIAD